MATYVLPHNFQKHIGKPFLQSFKCFHLNIRSVKNKKLGLDLLLEEMNESFVSVLLTETWSSDCTDVYRLAGYETYYLNRSAGGVSILM